MRLSALQFLCIFSYIEVSLAYTCSSENSTLCEICQKIGETQGVFTFFYNEQCSIYAGVQGDTGNYTIPERCELMLSKLHPTSCQLAVISDVDLLGYYIQYGIRMQGHSMLLSLVRENCSSKWNWWSRLENKTITAGVGDESEPCDVVQAAFVDYTLARVNPDNFTATGVLCQCSNQVSFLPVVKKADGGNGVYKSAVIILWTFSLWFFGK